MDEFSWIRDIPVGIKLSEDSARYIIQMDKTKTNLTIYNLEDKLKELFPNIYFCNWFNNKYIDEHDAFGKSYVLYVSYDKYGGVNCDWNEWESRHFNEWESRHFGDRDLTWNIITPEEFLTIIKHE